MSTCDTCKWWDNWRGDKYAHCTNKKVCNGGGGKDCAFCEGDFGDSPQLLTGPKFGCIHHEPK